MQALMVPATRVQVVACIQAQVVAHIPAREAGLTKAQEEVLMLVPVVGGIAVQAGEHIRGQVAERMRAQGARRIPDQGVGHIVGQAALATLGLTVGLLTNGRDRLGTASKLSIAIFASSIIAVLQRSQTKGKKNENNCTSIGKSVCVQSSTC